MRNLYIAILLCIFSVPFLFASGHYPVPRFFAEGSVLVCGVMLLLCGGSNVRLVRIPHIAIACFLFSLYLLLQVICLDIRLPGINFVVAFFVLIIGLISIAFSSVLHEHFNRSEMLEIVMWAIAISSFIQVVLGYMQYTGIAANYSELIMFVDKAPSNIFGNIGQKNDYVDFICMGLVALSFLFFKHRLAAIFYYPMVVFYTVVICITTSRTPFICFMLIVIWLVCFLYKKRQCLDLVDANRRIIRIVIFLLSCLVILEILIPYIAHIFQHQDAVASGLQRLTQNINQGTYRRFYEWYKEIIIFLQHPLLGIGWYQYPHDGIYIMLTERFSYIPANYALYTHSHNIVFNILAECGLVGFVITICYGLVYSIYSLVKNYNDHDTLFVVFLLLIMCGQSLLQFPLWYVYFLTFFVLLLSFDKPIISFKSNSYVKLLIVCLSSILAAIFFYNVQIYRQVTNMNNIPEDFEEYANNVHQLQDLVDDHTFWSLPALTMLNFYMFPGSAITNNAISINNQVKYIDLLGNELPYVSMIFKQIVIHKIIGDEKMSLFYAKLLAHAFPGLKDSYLKQLRTMPVFSKEIDEIEGFHYEDRSLLTKFFNKGN